MHRTLLSAHAVPSLSPHTRRLPCASPQLAHTHPMGNEIEYTLVGDGLKGELAPEAFTSSATNTRWLERPCDTPAAEMLLALHTTV